MILIAEGATGAVPIHIYPYIETDSDLAYLK